MELKNGYKQTDIGVIPEDWEVKSIDEVFDFHSTSNYSKAQMNFDGDIGCLHYGLIHAIPNSSYDLQNGVKYFVTKQQAKYEFLKDGDIVMVDASEDLSGINKSVEVSGVRDNLFIAGLHTFLLRDRGFYKKKFRGVILNSSIAKVQMLRFAVGMKVYGVSKPQLKAILLPLPPLKEQTAIAEALSDADVLIQSTEKLIAKKRMVKQAAMQQLLSPKEGWQVKRYGEIFDFLNTATYSRAQLNTSESVGYIHYGDIHTKWDCFLDLSINELPSISTQQASGYSFVKDGDVIMADASEDYSGIGKSVEVKNVKSKMVVAGLHTMLLRDKEQVFVDGYRGYIHATSFVKSQFDRLATGMKVYGVSKNNLKTVQISIPEKEEQTRIATILSDMDAEITALEAKLQKYRHIKQGMMQNLLTGKIRLV
ncbi:MAG: restriction endonuclease subunit S [Flavipsychrobacter sp.]|nr:restriction endonuclease subunit S [Flavipsychrobacter sp.]